MQLEKSLKRPSETKTSDQTIQMSNLHILKRMRKRDLKVKMMNHLEVCIRKNKIKMDNRFKVPSQILKSMMRIKGLQTKKEMVYLRQEEEIRSVETKVPIINLEIIRL